MMSNFTFILTVLVSLWADPISNFNNFDQHSFPIVVEKNLPPTANLTIPPFHKSDKDNQLELSTKDSPYRLQTVVIDPGHGGHDDGCSGKHSKEKKVVLQIAKKLGSYINSVYPNIKVIYTRKKDVFVPLYTRANIANKNNADLFISIHCNAISKQQEYVRGTETYVMGVHNTEENLLVAKRENAAILLEDDHEMHYDGFDPNSPEGHIILSMVQNAYFEQSILFAEKLEYNFKHLAGRKSRGVKQAGFVVLRKTAMPSVLIESGYLTNSREERFMNSDQGQDDLANSIFRAFQSYKNEMESETMNIPPPAPARIERIQPQKMPIQKEKFEIKKEEKPPVPQSNINPAELRKYYTVQLAATKKPTNLSAKKWKKVNFLVELKREKGKFKYLAGKFENLNKATEAEQKLRAIGFKDAFVVAYKGDQRVGLHD